MRHSENPVLDLPTIAKLRALPESVRLPLRDLLRELALDARGRAEESWRRHKGPMAVYWRAVSVYAGHTARALR